MIISVHVPKTAGRSFRLLLETSFPSRAFFDYGDAPGFNSPQYVARREKSRAEMRSRRDELLRDYDIIHGHFLPEKYAGLFPSARFAAFFRDPYQQTLSHFHFFRRNPQMQHPAVRLFHEKRMTVTDFAAAFPDLQSVFLGELGIDDFAMIGLTEQYERSLALFQAVFGYRLSDGGPRENVNPERGDAYHVDAEAEEAVGLYRSRDVAVYRQACGRFESLAARYGV